MEKETRNEQMLSNREDDVFFAQQTPEILRAVCRGLGGEQCPAVYVSQALMVLGETKAGGRLFAERAFYCVESFLPHEAGQLIRQCMAQHTEQEPSLAGESHDMASASEHQPESEMPENVLSTVL